MASVMSRDPAPDLAAAFWRNIPEQDCEVRDVRGSLPRFIDGTCFFNGPAKFRIDDGLTYRNWLDGDGMVCSLKVSGGRVRFRSRYVQGNKFVREMRHRKRIYRAFGTSFDGDRLKRGLGTESPYNVSVFPYLGKLLACGEQSLPMELDPETLETINPGVAFDFDRALNDAAPFSAHPKIDGQTGELLNFGVFYSPSNPILVYYRFDSHGKLACRSRVPLELPVSLHDFAVSDNYVAFYLSPYVLDTKGLTEDGKSTIDSLAWHPEIPSQLLILSRASGEEVMRLLVKPGYCLHTINAFEEDETLICDLIEFERPVYDQYQELPDLYVDVPLGQPVRYEIDLMKRQVAQKTEIAYRSAPEFPIVDSRRSSKSYDDLWMLGISAAGSKRCKFFDQLVHARWSDPQNLEVWKCPPGHYLASEPVFIAGPSTESGAIICHVWVSSPPASYFAIFESDEIAGGPVASVWLETPSHLAFHGAFMHTAR